MDDRRRQVLERLGAGITIQEVCDEFQIKKHTIKRWKQGDQEFRDEWNKTMKRLGRVFGIKVDL